MAAGSPFMPRLDALASNAETGRASRRIFCCGNSTVIPTRLPGLDTVSATNKPVISDLLELFRFDAKCIAAFRGGARELGEHRCGDVILDRCGDAECLFLRTHAGLAELDLRLLGDYSVAACSAGGWLIASDDSAAPSFWIPVFPTSRRVDLQGHILEETPAKLKQIAVSTGTLMLALEWRQDHRLDLVVWRFSGHSRKVVDELVEMPSGELQPIFLWGSHTSYECPADVYAHLVHGWIYENRKSWPKYWKICSENDAHALYVALRGLQLGTGKSIYDLLKRQLLLCVLARQEADGAWRHGEWTDAMESHFRLCASATHMLMDALAEADDQSVRNALARAAAFLAGARDETGNGVWFLHDDLERSSRSMAQSPFQWISSRFLGKSPSNMMVLNTHLDICIALDRYRTITGDDTYAPLVRSGQSLTTKILSLRPAEWLYRLLFKAISLTQLPTERARQLPLALRAVKRVARERLLPNLHRIKAVFPRLVMPGGYVDRSLCLRSGSFHYLAVNAMDLLRYYRRFRDPLTLEVARNALALIQHGTIRERWRELPQERYAVGFWAEALYHLCLLEDDHSHRAPLARAAIELDEEERGMPPSVLGANCEAVSSDDQRASPLSTARRLRVLNLCRKECREWVFVNTGTAPATLPTLDLQDCRWVDEAGSSLSAPPIALAPKSWCRVMATAKPAKVSPAASLQSALS